MKKQFLPILVFATVTLLIAATPVPMAAQIGGKTAATPAVRERLLMDSGWRFAFGHPSDAQKDFGTGTGYFSYLAKTGYGDGAAAANFDDRAWRMLDLPHDWAVEVPFDGRGSHSHGYKAIGRNFPTPPSAGIAGPSTFPNPISAGASVSSSTAFSAIQSSGSTAIISAGKAAATPALATTSANS